MSALGFGLVVALLTSPATRRATADDDSVAAPRASAEAAQWRVQTRDPQSSELRRDTLTLNPKRMAVIVIDPWNYHWCMTWTEQAGGTVPRLNHALAGARRLGMPVIWAPSDVASMYSGYPQRERALAVPYEKLPSGRAFRCPFTVASGFCHCGPGIPCVANYGHDAMPKDIDLRDSDWIASGTAEVYSICKKLGVTHLVYTGGAVNICLTGKPEGLGPMYATGIEGLVARDLVEAWTHYDPETGYTPDDGNAQAVADVERAGFATIHFADELRRRGLWDDDAVTEPVRITPAGKPQRPFFFAQSVTVSLDAPWLADAPLHYTTDGSEPTPRSPRYVEALKFTETTSLRTAAFREGKRVSIESSGYWVRLPDPPPPPDVHLDALTPVTDLYAQVNSACAACLWHPKVNNSYEGLPLRIRGHKYEKGIGMRAPAYRRYEIQPEWDRFVGLAGVADNMLDRELGRNIAAFPSVVFHVYVDGQFAEQSPVMRISQSPWRFDVPLPRGARVITLSVTDAGDRSPYDLANWVNTGFVLRAREE